MKKLRRYLGQLKAICIVCYYDMIGFYKHSMMLDVYKTQQRLLGLIVARYHVVEKGLTMPEMRLGFGYDNLMILIELCAKYAKKFDVSAPLFVAAIEVLKEYEHVHEKAGFELKPNLKSSLANLLKNYQQIDICQQKEFTKEQFLSSNLADFKTFAHSRCTVRNYSQEEIPLSEIEKVIALAQTTPTACNRQPVRVHVVLKDKINDVLQLQNGNRGFGDIANKLLIVSVDRSSYLNVLERNAPYVDGGIYLMNLLYALHYYKIGACILNWSATPKNDKALKTLLQLPKNEVVVGMISIGYLPEQFKVATSHKIDSKNITTIH